MIKGFFDYFRLLSLDVVLGACVSTLFIANCLGMTLPFIIVVALGIAVWVIYTTDHLLDGAKLDKIPLTKRHQFHQSNQKYILIALVIAIISGLVLVTQLPSPVIINGVILISCVVIYFIGLKIIGSKPAIYKEPLVAIAYASGVFLGPVSLIEENTASGLSILFIIYMLLAFINLLIFSVYEEAIDEGDDHTSLVRYMGRSYANYLITTCFVGLFALWSYQVVLVNRFEWSSIVLLIMIISLAAINYFKKVFEVNELYRMVGDAVFYFPLIILL